MEFATPARFEDLEKASDGLCVKQVVDIEVLPAEEADDMVESAKHCATAAPRAGPDERLAKLCSRRRTHHADVRERASMHRRGARVVR